MTNIMSNSKSVSSIIFAFLVEQGLINYDDPVSKHWPEFANNGKENMTIADVQRHESGMMKLPEQLELADMTSEGLKSNNIGKVIEETKACYFPGVKRTYHSFSRDLITNEIFRRVDP
jgi:CubicO group peptidase (beta-lactamase class C family)